MKTSTRANIIRIILFSIIAFSLTSCASSAKRKNLAPKESPYAPLPSESAKPAAKVESTVFLAQLQEAYGYATAGILLQAAEDKVKIDKIYASGTSALTSALYAVSKNRSKYEWALQKIDLEQVFEEKQGIKKLFQLGNSVDQRLKKLCADLFKETEIGDLKSVRLAFWAEGKWITEGKISDAVYASITKGSALSAKDVLEVESREMGRLLSSALTEPVEEAEMRSKFNGALTIVRLNWNSFAPPTYHEKVNLIFAGKESFEAVREETKGWPKTQ